MRTAQRVRSGADRRGSTWGSSRVTHSWVTLVDGGSMRTIGLLAAAVGCSDYELSRNPDPAVAPPDEPVEAELPPVVPPSEPAEPPPAVAACDTFVPPDWVWVASPPVWDEPDPVDMSGVPFFDPVADTAGWEEVALPH